MWLWVSWIIQVLEREGNFVEPTIVEIDPSANVIREELFVPILYVMKFKDLEQAIDYNNSVPQGNYLL